MIVTYNSNEEKESCEEPCTQLCRDTFRDIHTRIRNLFAQVTDPVHSTNSICTIQHASQEHESRATVARQVRELRPDEGTTSISSASLGWHNSTDQDGDDQETNAKNTACISHSSKELLPEHDKQIIKPRDPQESEEDMPALGGIVRMVQGVHGNSGIGTKKADRRRAKDPRKAVPPTTKP